MNGHLKKHFHGKRSMNAQVSKILSVELVSLVNIQYMIVHVYTWLSPVSFHAASIFIILCDAPSSP